MTQAEIEQAVESIRALFRETDQRLDRRFEATEREIEALSAQARAVENLFTKRRRLLEALEEQPEVAELFQVRGIAINRRSRPVRAHLGGEEPEIDLLLVASRGGQEHPQGGGYPQAPQGPRGLPGFFP